MNQLSERDLQAVEAFNFSEEMMDSGTYNLYEQSIDSIWNPREIDYKADANQWSEIAPEKRAQLLRLTTNFFASEQVVAEEIAPLMLAANELGRFDWIAHLSTFCMEEVKHAEFFAQWHKNVPGIIDAEELIEHFPTGAVEEPSENEKSGPRDLIEDAMAELIVEVEQGDREDLERAFVRAVTVYNVYGEGVAGRPAYDILIDACEQWGDILSGLQEGFQNILRDEGRHILGGSIMVRELLQQNPNYEKIVRNVFEENRETLIGFIGYQELEGLDMYKYQEQKARHYKKRYEEMELDPNWDLYEEIKSPDTEYFSGVTPS
jgi:ribonucleoside-diphosphate reductase beta chain